MLSSRTSKSFRAFRSPLACLNKPSVNSAKISCPSTLLFSNFPPFDKGKNSDNCVNVNEIDVKNGATKFIEHKNLIYFTKIKYHYKKNLTVQQIINIFLIKDIFNQKILQMLKT